MGIAETEILAQMAACSAEREASGYDRDLAASAASLARSLASVMSERRQQEKHVKQMVERMSPAEQDALVLEYLKELTPERRAEVRVFMDQLDAEENLLG